MATQKKRLQVSLTDEQYEILLSIAQKKGISKSAILALSLEEYAEKQLVK